MKIKNISKKRSKCFNKIKKNIRTEEKARSQRINILLRKGENELAEVEEQKKLRTDIFPIF